MPKKTIQLKEAIEFARENGYIYAVYKKISDGNFHLSDSCLSNTDLDEDETTPIIVKTTGACTDFNEFTTEDGKFCFRLHNNFNLPEVIPCLKKGELESAKINNNNFFRNYNFFEN